MAPQLAISQAAAPITSEPTATPTNGSTCPQISTTVQNPICPVAAIPSRAFFARPYQTSLPERYIRHVAKAVASQMSVENPAFRYARGSVRPSWSDALTAACPPTFA